MENKIIERIRVVATAAVTWLTLAALVLTQLAEQLPDQAELIAQVIASLAVAVSIIRRVTPVAIHERGILPRD